MAERYATRAGSAFELDFDHRRGIVLLANFLHHFDVPTCESLLRKVAGFAETERTLRARARSRS